MDGTPIPIETLLAHREWVRSVARAVVRDESAADDVEQETWLAALTTPPHHAGALRGWLGAVVRSRARRAGRSDARRERREIVAARGEATAPAAELAEIADTHRRVVQAVVELAEPYRQTLLLRYFEGCSVERVAATTGVPIDTARARISRGLAKLRERLGRELGTSERPLALALVPLIAGNRGTAAGAATGAAAAGGGILATKTLWAAAAIAVAAGVTTLVVLKWPVAAKDAREVAAVAPPADVAAPPPAPVADAAVAAGDDGPAAPAPDAAPVRSAQERLDAVKVSGTWQDTPVLEILGELAARADVDFFLSEEGRAAMGEDPAKKRLSLQMEGVPAATLASMVAASAGLSVAVEEDRVVVLPGDGRRDESKTLLPIPRLDANAKRTIAVKGVVVDESGIPVPEASIVSTAAETRVVATAARDGTFTFEVGRPFGFVHAAAPGQIASWARRLDGEYGQTVDVRLALRGPGVRVEGTLRDADGRETPGARVDVAPSGAGTPPADTIAAPLFRETAADGAFAVDGVPPGEFDLTVRPRVGPVARAKGRGRPGETVRVDVTLTPTTTWRGVLRGAGGAPVAKALVHAGGTSARTKDDGSFEIAGLVPGPVRAQIQTPDRRMVTKSVTIPDGPEFWHDLSLGEGGRIAGRLLDDKGEPLAGLLVAVQPPEPWAAALGQTTVTRADGGFAFADLERGPYDVVLPRKLPVLLAPAVATDTLSLEVRVPAGARAAGDLVGIVVDAGGAPAASATVGVRDVRSGAVTTQTTDATGTFRLADVPTAVYLVWAGWGPGVTEIREVEVDAGRTLDLGTLRLAKPRRVALEWRVDDGAAAYVGLRSVLSEGAVLRDAARALRPGVSELELTPGRYVLDVSGSAVQAARRTIDVPRDGAVSIVIPVRAAEPRALELRFPGPMPRRARVRLLDADGIAGERVVASPAVSLPLLPGSYRVEVDVSATETLHGALEIPGADAPTVIEVTLR